MKDEFADRVAVVTGAAQGIGRAIAVHLRAQGARVLLVDRKRLYLDPRLQVAEVADRCGFCSPAYFASVLKKYMHCTPRAYAGQPQRSGAFDTAALGQARAAT